MANFKDYTLSNNGVIENRVSISGDGEIVSRDIMNARNVQHILDVNKEIRNGAHHNRVAKGHKAASIPIPIWSEWRKEWKTKRRDYMTWQTFLAAKLNSSEYSKLRTHDNKIYVPEHVRTTG